MATAIRKRIGIITRLDFSMPFFTPSTMTTAQASTKTTPKANGANGAEMKEVKKAADSAAPSPIGETPVKAICA